MTYNDYVEKTKSYKKSDMYAYYYADEEVPEQLVDDIGDPNVTA